LRQTSKPIVSGSSKVCRMRRDRERKPQISEKQKWNIFARGLDHPNRVESLHEIQFFAHDIFCAVEGAIGIDCDRFCPTGESVGEGDWARDLAAPRPKSMALSLGRWIRSAFPIAADLAPK
jgi:hypothetical protein